MFRITRLYPDGEQRTEKALIPNCDYLLNEVKTNTIKSFIVSKA